MLKVVEGFFYVHEYNHVKISVVVDLDGGGHDGLEAKIIL